MKKGEWKFRISEITMQSESEPLFKIMHYIVLTGILKKLETKFVYLIPVRTENR